MSIKKSIGVFLFIILCFSFILSRLYYLSLGTDDALMAALTGSRTKDVTIYESRGTIYDCKLRPFTDQTTVTRAVVDPMLLTEKELLLENVADDLKQSVSKSLEGITPFCVTVKKPITGVAGITCFPASERYTTPYNAIQTIGYVKDSEGVSGIEKVFNPLLTKNTEIFAAVFSVDAARRAISGLPLTTKGEFQVEKSGVCLTLDKDIQKACDEAANQYIKSGAIVVIDVKTGKIRALSSHPDFSPYDLQSVSSDSGAFLNRCFTPFNVGSAFKIADTAAFLESGGVPSVTAYCGGSITVGSNVIACQKTGGHGKIALQYAFEDSCNVFFITIMQKTGKEALLSMAENLGFGKETVFADGLTSKAGTLPTLKNLSAPAALANFSIGQGDLLATPVQLASMIQAVCNDGVRVEPSLIEGTVDSNSVLTQETQKTGTRAMSATTAAEIRQLMISTVEYGSGHRAKPENGGAGVKTATAQTGILKDGQTTLNGWIAGFFPAENPQYAVAVLVEDALSGAKSAGPAFKYVADHVTVS